MARSIKPHPAAIPAIAGKQAGRHSYKSKLLQLFPAETSPTSLLSFGWVIAAYLALHGIFQGQAIILGEADVTGIVGWTVFFVLLVLTPMYLVKIHNVREKKQLILTTISFAVWVYTLGGPFQMSGFYQPQIASCILVLWTLLIPLFIEPEEGKPKGS